MKNFGLINDEGKLIYGKKESFLRVLGTCVLVGIIIFFLEGMKWDAFVEGFFWPFTCIVIYSIFGLPLHFLKKKHPKAATIIKNTGLGIMVVFLVVLILSDIIFKFAGGARF